MARVRVYGYGEAAGSTTRAPIVSELRVAGKAGKSYPSVPERAKLTIERVIVAGAGDTTVYIVVADNPDFQNPLTVAAVRAANGAANEELNITVYEGMYVRAEYVQPTAQPVSVTLVGVLELPEA